MATNPSQSVRLTATTTGGFRVEAFGITGRRIADRTFRFGSNRLDVAARYADHLARRHYLQWSGYVRGMELLGRLEVVAGDARDLVRIADQ